MRKQIVYTFLLSIGFLFITTTAHAQWALGGSYQVRDAEPKKGFGVRLERDIGLGLPIINLGVRGHFNWFNETNQLNVQGENQSIEVGQDMESYDYGLTALVRLPLGIAIPYVGLGAGSNTTNINFGDEINNLENPNVNLEGDSESSFAYYGILGGEVPLLGSIRPFIEYRFSSYEGDISVSGIRDNIEASNGRTVFGVVLRF